MCLGSGTRSKLASTTVPNPLAERNEAKTKHEQLVSVYTLPQQGNPAIQCRGAARSSMWSRTPHLEISKPRGAYPFLCPCQEWHEICVSNAREVGYESYPYDRERPNTGMCADKYTSPFPSYRMATGGFGAIWEYSGLVGRTEYPTQDIMDVPQSGIDMPQRGVVRFSLPAVERVHARCYCVGIPPRRAQRQCMNFEPNPSSNPSISSASLVPWVYPEGPVVLCPPGAKRAHTQRYWVGIMPKRACCHHAHPEPIAFEPVKLGITTTFHARWTARAHTMSRVVTVAQEHRQEPMHNYCATARSCTYTLPWHTLALVLQH
ncbi:hypothetical protein B0H13DRAFT_1919113 [Mycena leptocephala]|nr:hypothetical protein B0H13DRAFT_1919113 [Mycena leptocephala]